MMPTTGPDRTEAVEYYFTYIDKVPRDRDILEVLESQGAATLSLLSTIPENQSLQRYGPDKWTIRQVVSHINDCERLFVFRAMWFARGLDSALPSFDQEVAIASAAADEVAWGRLIEEFRDLRAATVGFFRNLPADVWMRRGVASGNPFSVRALAYIAAGHVAHHVGIIRERYL